MVLPLWRSMFSLNLMLPKEDRRAMLIRIFDDDTPVKHVTTKKASGERTGDSTTPALVIEGEENSTEMSEAGGVDLEADLNASAADPEMAYADVAKDIPPPGAKTEDDYIKTENILRGEEQEELMASRETYQRDGDEEDRFNTTV